MNQYRFTKPEQVLYLAILLLSLSFQNASSQKICITSESEQKMGEKDGYNYELWNQHSQGTACMTLGSGALFSGEWNGIENYLARRGLSYDQTQKHYEIGVFYTNYNCSYNPDSSSGNSYLSVYGWTVNPLIEYYIVEDWRNWIPSMSEDAIFKGSIEVNGSKYDIYENTRVDKPSIIGNATFQQYFSIRTDKRNGGTINITDHFNKWETLGMNMGNMYEVAFVVEGYQSNGNFDFTALEVFLGDGSVHVSEEIDISNLLSIYPNPSTGNISIELNESIVNSDIQIYDASGKTIFSEEKISNNHIQMKNLKSGIYIVNMKNNYVNYTSRFLIL